MTEAWLINRFELFKTYYLPSVKHQTNHNFKWLVCFDSKTPAIFKKEIEKIAVFYSNFKPVYIDGFTDALTVINEAINSYLLTSDIHIITTRLDNDDALHRTFIDTIQNPLKRKIHIS